MREVKLLIALAAIVGLSTVASAGTVQYKILVNGQDVDTIPADGGGIVTPGVEFNVQILALVPDVDFGGGFLGGLLQYSIDLVESDDALAPTPNWIPVPPPGHAGDSWAGTSVAPLVNYAGTVNAGGADVLGQTGAIPPTSFDTNFNTFAAGVWSEVGSGPMTWNGNATVLDLVPGALDAQIIYGDSAGPEKPTAATGDSVEFLGIPEPATMSLLALGAVALLRRRK